MRDRGAIGYSMKCVQTGSKHHVFSIYEYSHIYIYIYMYVCMNVYKWTGAKIWVSLSAAGFQVISLRICYVEKLFFIQVLSTRKGQPQRSCNLWKCRDADSIKNSKLMNFSVRVYVHILAWTHCHGVPYQLVRHLRLISTVHTAPSIRTRWGGSKNCG